MPWFTEVIRVQEGTAQSLAVLSMLPESRYFPSGLKTKSETAQSCSVVAPTSLPVESQRVMLLFWQVAT